MEGWKVTSIQEIKLLDILPPNFKGDPDMIIAAENSDSRFSMLLEDVKQCLIIPNIDNITNHEVLDILAWDRHVDFYDHLLSIEQKQQIIKNSFKWHMKKGTPAAIEELITTVFGYGEVEEWFQYDGDPYNFIVKTNNPEATNEKALEFIKAVNSVKNARSFLEKVVLTFSENNNLNFAGIVHTGDYITIRQVI